MVSWLTGVRPARPQLRHEVLSPRGLARGAAVRRAAPLRAGAGRRPRLSRSARSSSSIGRGSFGHSKYGVRRFVKGFLDLLTVKFLTGFGQRPQHLLGTIGLVVLRAGRPGTGSTWPCYWVVGAVASRAGDLTPLHQRPAVLYSLGALLLGGPVDVDRLSGRVDHRLPGPRRRHLLDRRADAASTRDRRTTPSHDMNATA